MWAAAFGGNPFGRPRGPRGRCGPTAPGTIPRNHEPSVGLVADTVALARRCGRHLVGAAGFAKLVHRYRRLALAQTDDVLCLHVDLSVPRITRHFFLDPTGEVEFLIRVLQLNLCKHHTI